MVARISALHTPGVSSLVTSNRGLGLLVLFPGTPFPKCQCFFHNQLTSGLLRAILDDSFSWQLLAIWEWLGMLPWKDSSFECSELPFCISLSVSLRLQLEIVHQGAQKILWNYLPIAWPLFYFLLYILQHSYIIQHSYHYPTSFHFWVRFGLVSSQFTWICFNYIDCWNQCLGEMWATSCDQCPSWLVQKMRAIVGGLCWFLPLRDQGARHF